MFYQVTGSKQVSVRAGYADYDSFGSGNFAMAATGNLDAPDFMPQGSVRLHCTFVPCPSLSLAHRDGEQRESGCQHDGPDAPALPDWTEEQIARGMRYYRER